MRKKATVRMSIYCTDSTPVPFGMDRNVTRRTAARSSRKEPQSKLSRKRSDPAQHAKEQENTAPTPGAHRRRLYTQPEIADIGVAAEDELTLAARPAARPPLREARECANAAAPRSRAEVDSDAVLEGMAKLSMRTELARPAAREANVKELKEGVRNCVADNNAPCGNQEQGPAADADSVVSQRSTGERSRTSDSFLSAASSPVVGTRHQSACKVTGASPVAEHSVAHESAQEQQRPASRNQSLKPEPGNLDVSLGPQLVEVSEPVTIESHAAPAETQPSDPVTCGSDSDVEVVPTPPSLKNGQHGTSSNVAAPQSPGGLCSSSSEQSLPYFTPRRPRKPGKAARVVIDSSDEHNSPGRPVVIESSDEEPPAPDQQQGRRPSLAPPDSGTPSQRVKPSAEVALQVREAAQVAPLAGVAARAPIRLPTSTPEVSEVGGRRLDMTGMPSPVYQTEETPLPAAGVPGAGAGQTSRPAATAAAAAWDKLETYLSQTRKTCSAEKAPERIRINADPAAGELTGNQGPEARPDLSNSFLESKKTLNFTDSDRKRQMGTSSLSKRPPIRTISGRKNGSRPAGVSTTALRASPAAPPREQQLPAAAVARWVEESPFLSVPSDESDVVIIDSDAEWDDSDLLSVSERAAAMGVYANTGATPREQTPLQAPPVKPPRGTAAREPARRVVPGRPVPQLPATQEEPPALEGGQDASPRPRGTERPGSREARDGSSSESETRETPKPKPPRGARPRQGKAGRGNGAGEPSTPAPDSERAAVAVSSSEDEDALENFKRRFVTPRQPTRRSPSPEGGDDSFIDDDSVSEDSTALHRAVARDAKARTPRADPLIRGSDESLEAAEITPDGPPQQTPVLLARKPLPRAPPTPARQLSFMSSLATHLVEGCRRHPDAARFVKSFKARRLELSQQLFQMINNDVFQNQLPPDLDIKFNKRMLRSAGFCYSRQSAVDGSRTARVELSEKVVDCAERLRDTLVHELCHAAAWVVSGDRGGHGPVWKGWAARVQKKFPELPPVSRCHSYQIHCKFTYRCTGCGYSFGRHSKSLDTKKKVCGRCRGVFECLLTSKMGLGEGVVAEGGKGAATPSAAATPRAAAPFALFVKENYGSVKKDGTQKKHAEIMRELSKQFAKAKISKAQACANQGAVF